MWRLQWGVNRYGVSDGGNRVMSMMLLWLLHCWLWACFMASSCISFVYFEWVIADCLEMPLFLTDVNSLFTLI